MRSSEDRRASETGGRQAERLAAFWLAIKGYRILGRRIRTPVGELDMVAFAPGGTVCFIEVKARKVESEAMEAISPHQRARIARAAEYLVATRRDLHGRNARFDLVVILPRRLPRHLKDAWRP